MAFWKKEKNVRRNRNKMFKCRITWRKEYRQIEIQYFVHLCWLFISGIYEGVYFCNRAQFKDVVLNSVIQFPFLSLFSFYFIFIVVFVFGFALGHSETLFFLFGTEKCWFVCFHQQHKHRFKEIQWFRLFQQFFFFSFLYTYLVAIFVIAVVDFHWFIC